MPGNVHGFFKPGVAAEKLQTQAGVSLTNFYNEIIRLLESNGLEVVKMKGWRYFRYAQMLPVVRNIYSIIYPFVEYCFNKLGFYRFAYNLVILCKIRGEIA